MFLRQPSSRREPQRLRLACLAAAVALYVGSAHAAHDSPAGSMTSAEREYLVTELTTSKQAFLDSIKGLTLVQWTYKPAPDRWSVQECAEHIILAEEAISADAKRMLSTPAVARLPGATAEADRALVATVLDRSNKAKAPQSIMPTRRFPTPEAAAEAFAARRDKQIAYVASTQDALRAHAGEGPTGAVNDPYQVLLVMAAHSARHTAQIREVETSPGYPAAPAASSR